MPSVIKNKPVALSIRTGAKVKDNFKAANISLSVLEFIGVIFDDNSKLMQDVSASVNKLVESFAKRIYKLAEFGIDESQLTEAIEVTKEAMSKAFFSQSAQSEAHKRLLIDSGKVPSTIFEYEVGGKVQREESDIDLSDM
jgi:hypothetical protein